MTNEHNITRRQREICMRLEEQYCQSGILQTILHSSSGYSAVHWSCLRCLRILATETDNGGCSIIRLVHDHTLRCYKSTTTLCKMCCSTGIAVRLRGWNTRSPRENYLMEICGMAPDPAAPLHQILASAHKISQMDVPMKKSQPQ